MAANGINTQSYMTCPHGGKVQQTTLNSKVKVGGAAWSLLSDIDTISGCPLNSPCLQVQWLVGSARVQVFGQPVLNESSVGICIGAAGPAGKVQFVSTQTRGQST